MVKSMTGYGRAREMRSGRDITVEVRSVNNRYLDCTVKLPRAYIFAEDAIKTRVQKAISRGKVDVFVTIDTSAADVAVVQVNEGLAKGYYDALTLLKERFTLPGEITPEVLARFPDVLTVTKAEEDVEAIAADICAVLDDALAAYNAMRTVEVRSVNNRYLDCTVKMPRAYIFAEDRMKARVQQAISRGKVDVFVTIDASAADEAVVAVNEPLARGYYEALTRLKTMFSLPGEVTPEVLAKFPDVLAVTKAEEDVEAIAADICAVLDDALAAYNDMRAVEGEKLAADVAGRVTTIETVVGRVEERSPQTVAAYRQRLEAKMQEVLQSTTIDESRILTEAAIFADKVAVDEETVRLRSHIAQLRDMLQSSEPVGRKLDFLIQEVNRECNTIGSKCNDLTVARDVVNMKAEVEKIREQVQNME